MKRSAHVTIAASAMLAVSIASAAWSAVALAHPPDVVISFIIPGKWVKVTFEVYFLVVLGLSAWAIASVIEVLRLRRWGRISAVIASALMLVPPAYAILLWIMTEIVLVRDYVGSGVELPRVTLLWNMLWFLLPLWWLILFTRPNVKLEFARPRTPNGVAGAGNEGGTA